MSEQKWFVTRDDHPIVGPLEDENAASMHILKHQAMSVDWATRYEGWGWKQLPADTPLSDYRPDY